MRMVVAVSTAVHDFAACGHVAFGIDGCFARKIVLDCRRAFQPQASPAGHGALCRRPQGKARAGAGKRRIPCGCLRHGAVHGLREIPFDDLLKIAVVFLQGVPLDAGEHVAFAVQHHVPTWQNFDGGAAVHLRNADIPGAA